MDQDRPAPSPDEIETDAGSLGARLRAARLASGMSFAELSTRTRVNARFLKAIEQGDQSALPSRIFTMGYVRIYAQVLGLDELEAVEAYKREFPEPGTTLQAPTGVAFREMRRRSPVILGVLGAVVLAFLCWNIFQRLTRIEPPHPSDLAAIPKTWLAREEGVDQVLVLGGPRAAPPDQSVPPLYITRGLEAELMGDADDPSASSPVPAPPVQAAFNPRGALYGSPATNSITTLQANKPATLVVRQGDGRVLFARQLAAGDSWRAPMNVQATIDVSDAAAFSVYLNGELADPLPANQTPLSRLNAQAQSQRRAAEARAAAAAEAEARARTALAAQAAARVAVTNQAVSGAPAAAPVAGTAPAR